MLAFLRFGRGRRKFNCSVQAGATLDLDITSWGTMGMFFLGLGEFVLLVSTEDKSAQKFLGQWAAQVSLTSSASEGTCQASNKCSPYVGGGWAEPQCWLLRRALSAQSGSGVHERSEWSRSLLFWPVFYILFKQ